ncbi:SRPBCC family protein [Geodermatophilus sp. SYSU D01180]
MTSTENQENQETGGGGGGGGLLGGLASNPVIGKLGEAAKDYAKARAGDAVKSLGSKVGGVTDNLKEKAEGGGFVAPAAMGAISRVAQGDSPVKAVLGGVGTGIKEKIKGAFRKGGGAGGNKKFVNIVEDVYVGVPVNVAYDQWTQFQEFASFMKGVDSVDQADEVSSNWRVKVAKSRRNWKATITEQIPDRRIVWTTEGAKGTTKGVITFHPLADDLTQVLLVMEYYPQGLFEKTGNIWRAQGRRARLDLKHFRRFIMMRGEATGSWRGEIRDGEVVRGPDEPEPDETGAESPEEAEDQETGYDEEAGYDEEEEEAGEEEAGEEGAEEEEPEEETPEEAPEEEPAPAGAPSGDGSGDGPPQRRRSRRPAPAGTR